MSVPAANIVVTNTSLTTPYTIAGVTIQPQDEATFEAGELATLCLDLTFRAGYIGGVFSIEINGFGLNPSSDQTTDLLDMISTGNFG